jgi:hypothetical protein
MPFHVLCMLMLGMSFVLNLLLGFVILFIIIIVISFSLVELLPLKLFLNLHSKQCSCKGGWILLCREVQINKISSFSYS